MVNKKNNKEKDAVYVGLKGFSFTLMPSIKAANSTEQPDYHYLVIGYKVSDER